MTTQSDRENKSIVAANANINKYKTGKSLWEIFQMGYLKGAEDSDLEWQAKVRALIEVTGDLTTAYLAGLKPLQSSQQNMGL